MWGSKGEYICSRAQLPLLQVVSQWITLIILRRLQMVSWAGTAIKQQQRHALSRSLVAFKARTDEMPQRSLSKFLTGTAHLMSTVWAGSSSSFLPVLGTTILSCPFSSLASTWLGSTLSGSCRAGMGRQSDWEHHGAAEHALGSAPCLLLKQATGCRAEQWS